MLPPSLSPSSPFICEFLLVFPPPSPAISRYFSPPFLVRLFEFFFFFLLFFPPPPSPLREDVLAFAEPHHGGIPIGKTRKSASCEEFQRGVRRKEKFVAKFAAPIVIANIFIPSYSFRFSLSIFFLSSMRDDDGKNRSEFRR